MHNSIEYQNIFSIIQIAYVHINLQNYSKWVTIHSIHPLTKYCSPWNKCKTCLVFLSTFFFLPTFFLYLFLSSFFIFLFFSLFFSLFIDWVFFLYFPSSLVPVIFVKATNWRIPIAHAPSKSVFNLSSQVHFEADI